MEILLEAVCHDAGEVALYLVAVNAKSRLDVGNAGLMIVEVPCRRIRSRESTRILSCQTLASQEDQ